MAANGATTACALPHTTNKELKNSRTPTPGAAGFFFLRLQVQDVLPAFRENARGAFPGPPASFPQTLFIYLYFCNFVTIERRK